MNKWLIALFLILLLIVSVYIFIPSTLQVTAQTDAKCTVNGANRILRDDGNWHRWWPSGHDATGSNRTYLYNGMQYHLQEIYYNQYELTTSSDTKKFPSRLTLIQYSTDSLQLHWSYVVHTGNNPINRITGYISAKRLKQNARHILEAFKNFLEKSENIYGFRIQQVTTPKVYLVATSKSFYSIPSTRDIYELINRLSSYATAEKAAVTGYPMLNLSKKDSSRYECMVALPVERELPGKEEIIMRRIVTIKALAAEVKGGRGTIDHALNELEQYVLDYRLFSPAIPFESLVTNRLMVPDTSQWITRVYQPLL